MIERKGREFCWILKLPDELKLNVIRYLDRRRDLYHLSQTCRVFEDITLIRLYEQVNVEIPQCKMSSWNIGALPLFRPHVVQSMRQLSIRNGLLDVQNAVTNKRRSFDAGTIAAYVLNIIESLPEHQLRSFSFLHRTPIAWQTLDTLTQRHDASLRELFLYELEPTAASATRIPHNLTTLECRSVHEGNTLSKLIAANANTLQCLKLGQEKELVERYQRTRLSFLEQIAQPEDLFRNIVKLHNLPQLQEAAFFGLDLVPLIPSSRQEALMFCHIKSLTLESCFGSAEFLEYVAATFHHVQNAPDAPRPRIIPQMTEFLFRSEAPTNRLKDCLTRFLASFTGLRTLSLLFENATFLERASSLIAEHGPTLKTLVLETRVQPREHLGLDTSRPFGVGAFSQELWEDLIRDICEMCPNLVELGTGFPWNDEIVRLRKTRLPTLKNLRTIHVRNFPENQVLSQIGDYSIKEYASKFIDWVFPALVGGARPTLETLAIGPTLYESRWKSGGNRRRPPEFLRTHYFGVDWAKTRFGRWSPLITNVSEKYMEETRNQMPLRGVFEQVWLK